MPRSKEKAPSDEVLATRLIRQAASDYYESIVSDEDDAHKLSKRYIFYFVTATLFNREGVPSDLDGQINAWWDSMKQAYKDVSDGDSLEFPELPNGITTAGLRELYRRKVSPSFCHIREDPNEKFPILSDLETAQAILDPNDHRVTFVPFNLEA